MSSAKHASVPAPFTSSELPRASSFARPSNPHSRAYAMKKENQLAQPSTGILANAAADESARAVDMPNGNTAHLHVTPYAHPPEQPQQQQHLISQNSQSQQHYFPHANHTQINAVSVSESAPELAEPVSPSQFPSRRVEDQDVSYIVPAHPMRTIKEEDPSPFPVVCDSEFKQFSRRRPKKNKRPRTTTRALGNNPKRRKRPHEARPITERTESLRQCAFCLIHGDVPECEGKLLGPFTVNKKGRGNVKKVWLHRNCIFWSPKAFHDDNGKLQGVEEAFAIAMSKKCYICNGSGASLSCMHNGSLCCRPMHFRCGLTHGAVYRGLYNTYCAYHGKEKQDEDRKWILVFEDYIDKVPVPETLLMEGAKGCEKCKGDTYDLDRGSVLTCNICNARMHTKCLFPNLVRDTTFGACSIQGNFYCKQCIKCVKCGDTIDRRVLEHHDRDAEHSQDDEEEYDSVLCISCKHNVTHIQCLPEGVSPKNWRCDYCMVCHHCDVIGVSRDGWNETHEACPDCAAEIHRGGVVCPICCKVYREWQNIPMIQCDGCDKWIHAINCGKMTQSQFDKWHLGSKRKNKKFLCQICKDEKKRRQLERQKSGGSPRHRDSTAALFGGRRADFDAILRLVRSKDDDITFNSVRRASGDNESLETVFQDLAIGQDVCRLCCSTGSVDNMRFCVDCGEGFHDFCISSTGDAASSKLKYKQELMEVEDVLMSPQKDKYGRLGTGSKPWRCKQCDIFVKLKGNGIQLHPQDSNGAFRMHTNMQLDVGGSLKNKSLGTKHELKPPLMKPHREQRPIVPIAANVRRKSKAAPCALEWDDERACVLCGRQEDIDGNLGRLIPWASSIYADLSHSWVHVACLMWSNGVSIHGSEDGSTPDYLLGVRKSIIGKAKRTTCNCCAGIGASLTCVIPGCETSYHFGCAKDIGVTALINNPSEILKVFVEKGSGGNRLSLSNVHNLRILCHSHANSRIPRTITTPSVGDVQNFLETNRMIRAIDMQGYSPDSDSAPEKKALSHDRILSMRIGSLSVLKLGQLVPEVDDFIIDKCLVPLGYFASKTYWSFTNPGQRCIYFLEVSGHAQSGPTFVIRCSDDSSFRVARRTADDAWKQVLKKVLRCRQQNGMTHPVYQISSASGLQVFGLLNCIPVVTHIESLPMASMFEGRYRHKRVVIPRNNDIIFYNTLAKKFRPLKVSLNSTGCARTEGYLPKSRTARCIREGEINAPTYENSRTGSIFQLDVARERYSKNHGRTSSKSRLESVQAKQTHDSGARIAKTKSATTISTVAQHRRVAKSAKSRTVIKRSDIEGWGVFATEDIPAEEMIIEYVGEIIRPPISDIREKQYCDAGIGCYMFQIVPGEIVDATKCGNAARYINHSCAPNCYSKTITLENKRQVVVIIAKRRIQRGEELSYDYMFPLDETDRVKCECGARNCRGFMN